MTTKFTFRRERDGRFPACPIDYLDQSLFLTLASMKTAVNFSRKIAPFLLVALSLGNSVTAAEDRPNDSGAKTGSAAEIDISSIQPHRDPINDAIYEFRVTVRRLYNQRQFDELDKIAKEILTSKEIFDNGSWKIMQFYGAFEPREDEPESMWKLHEEIHRDWLKTQPDSLAAHVSFVDFLAQYAWHARGSDYAEKVTEEGWKLFQERLNLAGEMIKKTKALENRDPVLPNAALRVALGQGLPKEFYETLLREAHQVEPRYWGYDVSYTYYLLPRWHGKPGEWETYAKTASAREGGPGKEIYARIVLNLDQYYDNIFEESEADWQTTKEGLTMLIQKHPKSVEFPNAAALLAAKAQDRDYASTLFDIIGDRYFHRVWRSPELFAQVRQWAKTKE